MKMSAGTESFKNKDTLKKTEEPNIFSNEVSQSKKIGRVVKVGEKTTSKPAASQKTQSKDLISPKNKIQQNGQANGLSPRNEVKPSKFAWNKNVQSKVQTSKFGPKEFRKEMIKDSKIKKADFSGQDLTQINIDEYFQYEYLYFRDMELKTLDLLSIFPNLRSIDLSSNEIESLEFLQNMPALKHLSVSSNALKSLESIPAELVELESLSVGNNKIETFVGMPAFENLRVLNLQANFIENFNGFPILQSLDTIDLRDNPLVLKVGSAQLKDIIISLHKFAPLKRVNNEIVIDSRTNEEFTRAYSKFNGKVGYCIREGYLPPTLLPEVEISQEEEEESIRSIQRQSAAHLIQNQKQKTEGTPFELYHLELSPEPIEGIPTTVSFIFKVKDPNVIIESEELSRYTFTSEDESHEYLVLNSHHIPMDKGMDGTNSVTVLVPKGDYEYGYTKTSGETPESLTQISLNDICAPQDADHIDFFLLLQWFKLSDSGLFEEIPNANNALITPTVNDISSHLKAQIFCFDSESNIVFSVFDITDKIQETGPQCRSLSIHGELIQGKTLNAVSEYFGGIEGESIYKWYGAEDRIVEGLEYTLELSDVENTVRLEYTPVRNDGTHGETVTVESKVIEPSAPEILDLQLHGVVQEGETVSVSFGYNGGHQGECGIQWFRQNGETGEFELIQGETNREYSVVLQDVYHKLKVRVTPVSDKGVAGNDVDIISEVAEPALPRLLSLDITSLKLEEDKIIVTEREYYGGYEGKPHIQWFRVSPETENSEKQGEADATEFSQRILIEDANDQDIYKCSFEDVGYLIEVGYTPRRDDGVIGETVYCRTDGIIRSGPPKCTSIHINGTPIENGTLSLSYEYKGGSEGSSTYRWYRVPSNSVKDKEDEEFDSSEDNLEGEFIGKGQEYKITLQDIGNRIKVEYTPVREDGVEGEMAIAFTEVVEALPPTLSNIKLTGSFSEFEKIFGSAEYHGGFEKERRHKWIRVVESESNPEGERTVIDFATEETYFIDTSDVNTRIIYASQAVSTQDIESEWVESQPSPVIAPLLPTLTNVTLSGEPQEGKYLQVSFEGDNLDKDGSKVEWFRVRDDQEELVNSDALFFNLGLVDIGSIILCKVTPIRTDFGLSGQSSIIKSEVVRASDANVHLLELNGKAVEGGSLSVSYSYYGGVEGKSHIKWFRVGETTEEIVEASGSKEISLTTKDLNCTIKCEIIPVRDDGFEGIPQTINSEVVSGSEPIISNLELHGEALEEKSLNITYAYYGGFEGASEKKWYRLSSLESSDKIEIASNTDKYDIQLDDIDSFIQVECTPVRNDDVKGTPVTIISSKVKANPPIISNVVVSGNSLLGEALQVSGTYTGGVEGSSIFVWEESDDRNGPWNAITGASSSTFISNPDQLNKFIRATYTPIRKDGEKGTTVESQPTKIHMGSAHLKSLVDSILHGQFNVTQCQPSISLGVKNLLTIQEKNFKCNLDAYTVKVDSNTEDSFSIQFKEENIVLKASNRNDRDFSVLVCRLYNGLAQNDLTTTVFGSPFAAAWKKKKNIQTALEAAQAQVTASEKPTNENLGFIYEVMKAVLSQDM